MNETDRLRIAREVGDRLLDYWHEVDSNDGRKAGTYFTEDALWEAPPRTFKGRAEIQGFFDWRLTRGDRIALHTVNNLKVTVESATQASTRWYLVLYAGDGRPPQQTEVPTSIAAISDKWTCVDGAWLCTYRRFDHLFQGGNALAPPSTSKS